MVGCRTCGRLGNFLFQFSAVYGHARKYGFDWCMPSKSMQERLWPTPKFKNIKYCTPQPGKLIQEKGPQYQGIPAEDNLILEGYWQSEKYFFDYKQEIADILEFEIEETDYVAVHVRRGDYLKFPDEFPVLPVEYYEKTVQYFVNKGIVSFRVYSDDIKWCRNAFETNQYSSAKFTFATGKTPIDDMREMYNGAGMIIANSTFSLFPALLRTDNPVIIAPTEDMWFGKNAKHLNSKDRMPERFIKM